MLSNDSSHYSVAIPEQQSLKRPFTLRGIGLHSGVACSIEVQPSEPNSGRLFVTDGVEIPARADMVVDTSRCTSLGNGANTVRTVEHLMAALAGCSIDNARIIVNGPEVPILDGSSLPFVEQIINTGACVQGEAVRFVKLSEAVAIAGTQGGTIISASPAHTCEMCVDTEFANWPQGNFSVTMKFEAGSEMFEREIAAARTFAFAGEVQMLLDAGLARGGSIDNVVIITPPSTFSSPLRMPGEWWRHKVLDLIGDLALVDARIFCSVTAVRPGHAINTRMAAALLASVNKTAARTI